MIDFTKYVAGALVVRREGDSYKYTLPAGYFSKSNKLSKAVPFENLPVEIQERVAILLTAPVRTVIKSVGVRNDDSYFILCD